MCAVEASCLVQSPCFIRTSFICPDERGGRPPSPLSLGPSPSCRHLCSLAVLEPRADRLGDTVFWKVGLVFDESRSVEHWPLAAAFTGGSVTVVVINSICAVCLHSTRVRPSLCVLVNLGKRTIVCHWLLCFSSVQSLSCVQLCNPMDCSMPGFPVHHQLPELTQTHIHQVGDAIQPSPPVPFSSCLPSFLGIC